MIRALRVAIAILVVQFALGVSVAVSPPPDGRIDGRGVIAIVAAIVVIAVLVVGARAEARR